MSVLFCWGFFSEIEAAFRDRGPTCARQIRGTEAGRTEPVLRVPAQGASPLAVLDERPSGRSVISGTRVACLVAFSLETVTSPARPEVQGAVRVAPAAAEPGGAGRAAAATEGSEPSLPSRRAGCDCAGGPPARPRPRDLAWPPPARARQLRRWQRTSGASLCSLTGGRQRDRGGDRYPPAAPLRQEPGPDPTRGGQG